MGFVVLALLAIGLPADPTAADPDRQGGRGRFQMPGKEMLAPALVLLATALGYGALGTYTAQEGIALRFQPVAGMPTEAAFLSCMAVGMLVARLVMVRVGFGARPARLLPGMLWTTTAGLAALALLPGGLARHIASALVYGGGYSMVHTLVSTHVLETTAAGRRGAAFGATLFAFDSGIGLGSLAIGSLIGWASGPFGPVAFRFGWAAAALLALAAVPLSRNLSK